MESPLPYSVRSARHHFRNLLGVIRGFSELTKEGLDEGSSSFSHYAFMIETCDRIQKFMDRVLCSEEILKREEWKQPFWVNFEYDVKSMDKTIEALFILHSSDSDSVLSGDLMKIKTAIREIYDYGANFMKESTRCSPKI